MTLSDFLNLIPGEQEMVLNYEYFTLTGTQDALSCMLGEDVCKGIVINVEAENDVLKVWVKENACKNT